MPSWADVAHTQIPSSFHHHSLSTIPILHLRLTLVLLVHHVAWVTAVVSSIVAWWGGVVSASWTSRRGIVVEPSGSRRGQVLLVGIVLRRDVSVWRLERHHGRCVGVRGSCSVHIGDLGDWRDLIRLLGDIARQDLFAFARWKTFLGSGSGSSVTNLGGSIGLLGAGSAGVMLFGMGVRGSLGRSGHGGRGGSGELVRSDGETTVLGLGGSNGAR